MNVVFPCQQNCCMLSEMRKNTVLSCFSTTSWTKRRLINPTPLHIANFAWVSYPKHKQRLFWEYFLSIQIQRTSLSSQTSWAHPARASPALPWQARHWGLAQIAEQSDSETAGFWEGLRSLGVAWDYLVELCFMPLVFRLVEIQPPPTSNRGGASVEPRLTALSQAIHPHLPSPCSFKRLSWAQNMD